MIKSPSADNGERDGNRNFRNANNCRPLYQRMLGNAWLSLPEPIRRMHDCSAELKADGLAVVERGSGFLSRCVAKIFGFPEQGREIPLQVSFQVKDEGELWQRTFAGRTFSSFQFEGRGRSSGLLMESFGPFSFGLCLVFQSERLSLTVRRWCICGIPLPSFFAPSGDSYETVIDGRFCFNVEIRSPMIGLIVRYRGWLIPAV